MLSTYEMGRQPFGLASPAAWLREAGFEVVVEDLSRDRLDESAVRDAGLVALFLPMHTATRLALPVIARLRTLNPSAHLCAYGLYAPVNEALLRRRGVTTILGVEFEGDSGRARADGGRGLDRVASRERRPAPGDTAEAAVSRAGPVGVAVARSLRDAQLAGWIHPRRRLHGSQPRLQAPCRHCPVVPVYDGRFRVVDVDVVIADVRAQVAAGAAHITFGDPDFFNGIGHATSARHDARSGVSGRQLRRDHQGRASAEAPRRPAAACATPGARS